MTANALAKATIQIMVPRTMSRAKVLLILATMFAFQTSSTLIWARLNSVPPIWDPADHLTTAYDYYSSIANLSFHRFFADVFHFPHYYAPVSHLLTAGGFLLFGAGPVQSALGNIVALAILLFSTYKIGARLYSQRVGCLAALLVSSYHLSAVLLHEGFIDYLLMAEVTLSMWLMLRTNRFADRKAALIFGISVAAGLLTKQTFGFFFILPIMGIIWTICREHNWRALSNLLLAGALAAIIASAWYIPHLSDVIEIYRINLRGAAVEHYPLPLTPLWFTINLHYLALVQLQIPLTVLFVVGLAYSLRAQRSASFPLYLWIVGAYVIFTLLINKNPRYAMPYLPAFALITCSLTEIRGIIGRKIVPAAIIALSLMSFLNAQWPQVLDQNAPPHSTYLISKLNPGRFLFSANVVGYDHEPVNDDWSLGNFTRMIAAGRRPDETIRVGMTLNSAALNPSSLNWRIRLMDAEQRLPEIAVIPIFDADDRLLLPSCDYLITSPQPAYASFPVCNSLDDNIIVEEHWPFTKIGEVTAPDGTKVGVYKRGRQPLPHS